MTSSCEVKYVFDTLRVFCRNGKKVAEGVGFEPTVDYSTAVFKTAALNHSTTPPEKSRALKDCPRKVFFKLKTELN